MIWSGLIGPLRAENQPVSALIRAFWPGLGPKPQRKGANHALAAHPDSNHRSIRRYHRRAERRRLMDRRQGVVRCTVPCHAKPWVTTYYDT
jgi:hypothetical protein